MAETSSIPRIGFGTYKILGDDCVRAVTDALAIGYRHIDTAELYGNEREVGKALKGSGLKRTDVFVTSKVAQANFGPGQVVPHVKASLERLGLEKLDLLLLHWPSPQDQYRAEDYTAQLGDALDQGLATHIGVSNFTKTYLDIALKVLGSRPIATNQVECHVLLQNRPIVDYTKSKGIALTAYCPLARGHLSSHAGVNAFAQKHGATPEQIGLAFLLAEGHVVIPSSSKRERIQSNWDAQKITLTPADIVALRNMDERRRLVNGAWCPEWDV